MLQVIPDTKYYQSIKEATLPAERHLGIVLILQSIFQKGLQDCSDIPKILAQKYKIRYAEISSFPQIQAAIDTTSLEGQVKIIWIRTHANESQLIFTENGDGFFSSYDAFCLPAYRNLFQNLSQDGSIVLECCCAGGLTEVEKSLDKQTRNLRDDTRVSFSLPSGTRVVREKDPYNTDQFWLGDKNNEVKPFSYFIQNDGEEIKVPSLNVASAVAFLAEGRRVFSSPVKISANFFSIRSLSPFDLSCGFQALPLLIFNYSLPRLKIAPGSLSFEINNPRKQKALRFRLISRTDYKKLLRETNNSVNAIRKKFPNTRLKVLK